MLPVRKAEELFVSARSSRDRLRCFTPSSQGTNEQYQPALKAAPPYVKTKQADSHGINLKYLPVDMP